MTVFFFSIETEEKDFNIYFFMRVATFISGSLLGFYVFLFFFFATQAVCGNSWARD